MRRKKQNNCQICGQTMYQQNRNTQKYCRQCYTKMAQFQKNGMTIEEIKTKVRGMK